MNGQARRRAAALLEVLGIYVAGQGLTGLLIRLFGLPLANPLGNFTVGITDAELLTASRQMFVLLVLQYAGYFLLIFPINWWHRRQGPAAYGLTRAGHTWTALLLAALATAALAEWPVLTVSVVNSIHPLGETAPWRQAFFDTSWLRWEFWLFSAVMSWAFVAFVEELFFRGYCQRRLAEDWGNGAAIAGTACLFTFAHSQYLLPNVYSASMVAGLLVIAIGFGVVFAWTRSLIPSVAAHALINVPMTPPWQGVLLAAFVIGVVVSWRRGAVVFKRVFTGATAAGCVGLALVGMGYAFASRRVDSLVYAAVAMVVLAVGLEAMDRRRDSAAESASTSA